MKKIFYSLIFSFGLLLGVSASAATDLSVADKLTYPIAELGGCTDKVNCQIYCDKQENMIACVDFGAKNGMISAKDAALAKKVIPQLIAGKTPGGCKDQTSCEAFCQGDSANIQECIDFAEANGILPATELAQAKKVAAVLKAGGKMPGSCTNKITCEAYCADTDNMEECLNFADQSGILPKNEIAEARKVMKYLQNGETPGACKTKTDCTTYCADGSHFDECIAFAEKSGVVSKEEADIAKKAGGKGPGDCKSQTECSTYCNKQENAKECADFAIEKGLVSKEEEKNIKEGAAELSSSLKNIPADARPDIESCLSKAIGADNLAQLEGGTNVSLTQEQGDKIKPCFDSVMKAYTTKMQQQAPAGASSGRGSQPSEPSSVPPPATDLPSGTPPPDYMPDAATCAQFAGIPSCDMAGSGKSICEKCK